eukprot:1136228-Pelagomonas_calceolata.AAC.5
MEGLCEINVEIWAGPGGDGGGAAAAPALEPQAQRREKKCMCEVKPCRQGECSHINEEEGPGHIRVMSLPLRLQAGLSG